MNVSTCFMFRNDIVGVSQTKVVDILISRMSGWWWLSWSWNSDPDTSEPFIQSRAGQRLAQCHASGPFISGKWDKLFSRFGGQVLVLGLNGTLSAPSLVFEVNISLTSLLDSTEASRLCAMQLINQIQFSVGEYPDCNQIIYWVRYWLLALTWLNNRYSFLLMMRCRIFHK